MKSAWGVRHIDDVGRLILPMDLRRKLHIEKGGDFEVFMDDEMIVMRKYQPSCIFCESMEQIEQYKGRNICAACRARIGAL